MRSSTLSVRHVKSWKDTANMANESDQYYIIDIPACYD